MGGRTVDVEIADQGSEAMDLLPLGLRDEIAAHPLAQVFAFADVKDMPVLVRKV